MALPDYLTQDSTTYKSNLDSTAADHETRIDTLELIGVDTSGNINMDRSTAEKQIRFTGPLGSIYIWGEAASTGYDVGWWDAKNGRHILWYDESANLLYLNPGLAGTSFKDEDNMVSNSATAAASQQSIVAYIAAQIADFKKVSYGLANTASSTIFNSNESWTASNPSSGVVRVTHNLGNSSYNVVATTEASFGILRVTRSTNYFDITATDHANSVLTTFSFNFQLIRDF